MSSPTSVLLGVLLGIICIDLKHDFNPNTKYAQHYYHGQMNFFFPVVEAMIALLGVSLIVETFFLRKSIWTKIGFVGLIAGVGIFIVKLIPLEQSLQLEHTNAQLIPVIEEIKQWHLILSVIVVYGIVAFSMTHCEKPQKQKAN